MPETYNFHTSSDVKGDYHYGVSRHDHEYGEYIGSIDFEKDVFEEIDRSHLINGLGKHLIKSGTVSGKIKGDIAQKRGRMKAEELLENGAKEQITELVKGAIEEGFIWKFRLRKPWHPKIFADEDRLTTFPFQHRNVIVYSAKKRHIFYTKSGKEDILEEYNFESFHNPDSILEQGHINIGVHHENEDEPAKEDAIYSAVLGHTERYPLSGGSGVGTKVVLELEAPIEALKIYIKIGGEEISNLEHMKNKFGSPEGYREHHVSSDEFKIMKPLNIERINGIWPWSSKKKTPYFMSLEHYAAYLYSKKPERMPAPEEWKLPEDRINEAKKSVNKQLLNSENYAKKKLNAFGNHGLEDYRNVVISWIKDAKEFLSSVETFHKEVEDYGEFKEEIFRKNAKRDILDSFKGMLQMKKRYNFRLYQIEVRNDFFLEERKIRSLTNIFQNAGEFESFIEDSREFSKFLLEEHKELLEKWDKNFNKEQIDNEYNELIEAVKEFNAQMPLISASEEGVKEIISWARKKDISDEMISEMIKILEKEEPLNEELEKRNS